MLQLFPKSKCQNGSLSHELELELVKQAPLWRVELSSRNAGDEEQGNPSPPSAVGCLGGRGSAPPSKSSRQSDPAHVLKVPFRPKSAFQAEANGPLSLLGN